MSYGDDLTDSRIVEQIGRTIYILSEESRFNGNLI